MLLSSYVVVRRFVVFVVRLWSRPDRLRSRAGQRSEFDGVKSISSFFDRDTSQKEQHKQKQTQQLEEKSKNHQNQTGLNHSHDTYNSMCHKFMVLLLHSGDASKDDSVKQLSSKHVRSNNNESKRVVLLNMSTTQWFLSTSLLRSRSPNKTIFVVFYRPFTDQILKNSISTTKHRPHSIFIANHIKHTKQSYHPRRLTGASLFLVGEDATSQLRTTIHSFLSLSTKNDPLSFPFIRQCILTCSLSFPIVFPFIFALLVLTGFFSKIVVFASPKLCPFALSSHSTNTRFINNTNNNKQTSNSKQTLVTQRQQAWQHSAM